MINIPAKVKERIVAGIKRYQPIIKAARDKDINESDTVAIITDMLADIYGYEKYTEITSEYAIKKTYCDLAIKLNDQPRILVEVKAAGLDLKEQHIRQAVDYGSNSGIDWVVLTNAVTWKVYKVIFAKPIATDLVFELDFLTLNTRKDSDLEFIYYLTREAVGKNSKAALEAYHAQKQLLNKYIIGQILLSDAVLESIRKTMKKISADSRVTDEEIKAIITDEVIKRDVLDDDRAADAKKFMTKLFAQKPAAEKPVKAETGVEA